jgi:hypothetical protein
VMFELCFDIPTDDYKTPSVYHSLRIHVSYIYSKTRTAAMSQKALTKALGLLLTRSTQLPGHPLALNLKKIS